MWGDALYVAQRWLFGFVWGTLSTFGVWFEHGSIWGVYGTS